MSKNKPTGLLRQLRAKKAKIYEGPQLSKEERLLRQRFQDMKVIDMETEHKVERTR